jgi:hypothetical protein
MEPERPDAERVKATEFPAVLVNGPTIHAEDIRNPVRVV